VAVPISYLFLRRSIFIAAPVERTWQEFETFERLKAWFGTGHELTRFEPGPGGWLETDAGEWDGERLVFGGRIIDWDPPHGFTFENDWSGHGWAAPPLFTFQLSAVPGGTVVELLSHGFERVGPSGPDDLLGFENGWTMRQLEALRAIVAAG
jgi:uncharacterized protein YndB with AHSA1/START domain